MTHPMNSAQNIYLSAFRRGKEAARSGGRSTDNPYHFTKDLPRNAAWRDGFYAERDKMRDERQREIQKSMDARPENWVPLSGVRDNKRVERPGLEPASEPVE